MQIKRKSYVIIFLLLLSAIVVMLAYSVWTHYTIMYINEPFEVESNLPSEIKAYPGETLEYYIRVYNRGSTDLMAVLTYTVEPSGGCTITPPSGASMLVRSGDSVVFNISVKIHEDAPPGEIAINWTIDRAAQ